jgi:hypothetical protein
MHPDPQLPLPRLLGMADVSRAFGFLGQLLKMNGRRKVRAELEHRMRWVRIDPFSQARLAPMESRAFRRERVRQMRRAAKATGAKKRELRESFVFRPVYGYVGPAAMPTRRVNDPDSTVKV